MKCPHLIQSGSISCNALDKPYFPSRFQLKEYCKTNEHKKCPFYLKDISKPNTLVDKVSL